MKKYIIVLLCLAAALNFSSCATDTEEIGIPGPEQPAEGEMIPMSLTFTGKDGRMHARTSLDGRQVLWAEGDGIGIFSPQAYYEWTMSITGSTYYNKPARNIRFDVSDGIGTPGAQFSISSAYDGETIQCTGNWGWNVNETAHHFYAYYPYADASKANTPYESVPFTLPGLQTQASAGDASHIGPLDFMWAASTLKRPADATDKGVVSEEVHFDFQHVFSLLRFTVTNRTDAALTVERIVMDGGTEPLAGDFTVNVSDGTLVVGKTLNASGKVVDGTSLKQVTLALAGGAELAPEASLTAWMVIRPADLSGDAASFTVETSAGSQHFTGGTAFEAGAVHEKTLVLTEVEPAYTLQVVGFEEVEPSALAGPTAYGANLYDGYADQFIGYHHSASDLYFGINESAGVYNFWNGGFALSQWNDMETASIQNQCSVYCNDGSGNGGHDGSATFAVANGYLDEYNVGYGISFSNCYFQDATTERVIDHVWIANATYPVLSMRNGDQFAKKFSYENQDWFKLSVTGVKADGTKTATVEFYLADFRTADAPGILTEWTKVDLASLGAVNKVEFNLSSSDSGMYGMNTPAYFCLDDVAIRIEK